MRRRFKRLEQVANFKSVTPEILESHFSKGQEKMPPRFTFKGISIAVRVLGNEIRHFTQRKTGHDLGELCKTKRPEIFQRIRDMAKDGITFSPSPLTNKLNIGRLDKISLFQNNLPALMGSLSISCYDELFLYDDLLDLTEPKQLQSETSRGDITEFETDPNPFAKENIINDWCKNKAVRNYSRLRKQFAVFPSKGLLKYQDLPVDSRVSLLDENGWTDFTKKDSWKAKRRLLNSNGLYVYKIHGNYDDISAYSFYRTQVDIDYRLKWDCFALHLKEIDKPTESSDVIHWITKCPYPMKNREYVFERNFGIIPEENAIVILSRITEHDDFPEKTDLVRVTSYGSEMVIKPHGEIDENGFEFTLTYYDDPQSGLPSYCLDMLARTGISSLMDQIHEASRKLQKEDQKKEQQLSLSI